MILKRRLYIVAFVLVIFIASAIIAMIASNESSQNYKGTLVHSFTQEANI